jgi:hypothetical protein
VIQWTRDLSGFSLSSLWHDVAEGRVERLTITVSFDRGKQLSFRGFPHGKTGLADKFGFERSKAAFDGRNSLFWIGCLDYFAVFGCGVLAAAIRMVDQVRMCTVLFVTARLELARY